MSQQNARFVYKVYSVHMRIRENGCIHLHTEKDRERERAKGLLVLISSGR